MKFHYRIIFIIGLMLFSPLFSPLCSQCWAHDGGENFLNLIVNEDHQLSGTWEIPLQQLEDLWKEAKPNADGRLLVAKQNRQLIARTVADDVVISDGENLCNLKIVSQDEIVKNTRQYESINFTGTCKEKNLKFITVLWLFLREDPETQKLLISFQSPSGTVSTVISNHEDPVKFGLVDESQLEHFKTYVVGGVLHIWNGIDHILFLITLLLPAVYFLSDKGTSVLRKWVTRQELRPIVVDVLKTVSAFTLAHSITLCLVTFNLLHLPGRLVESTIAFSVLLAGLNNLFPVTGDGRWKFAFLFGLIHGVGFAEVLVGMKLPLATLINSLIGYNLGVEIGQLSIVAVFLPIAFFIRHTLLYRRIVFMGGSMVTALIAALWLIDRLFNLEFMPF